MKHPLQYYLLAISTTRTILLCAVTHLFAYRLITQLLIRHVIIVNKADNTPFLSPKEIQHENKIFPICRTYYIKSCEQVSFRTHKIHLLNIACYKQLTTLSHKTHNIVNILSLQRLNTPFLSQRYSLFVDNIRNIFPICRTNLTNLSHLCSLFVAPSY